MLLPALVSLIVTAQGTPPAKLGVTTASVAVEVQGGSIVRMTNRLTGEVCIDPTLAAASPAAIHWTGQQPPWSPESVAATRPAPGVIVHRSLAGEDRLSTRCLARSDGTVEVKQDAAGDTPGIYGASWSVATIPERLEVLVPGNSGQRFGPDAPYETRTFEYPIGWEAPFVLIQGPKGGVLIQAEDPTLSPKALSVERAVGGYRLRFESRNEAPFDDLKRLTGKRWLIRAYKGPWQVGAEMYRAWAAKAYSLKPLTARRPAWAAGIRLVAAVGMDLQTIRLLARRVNPKQTLLYVPGWRRDGYDRNYPDYTAAPEFGPFVMEAHRLGYSIMPHVNYFGCDPKNPEYERFRKHHMRDPFTKELLWWDWKLADPPIKFAYINPGSREWRKLFIERMTTLCRQYDIDALHLDQTLCIFNDANGRVDGMSCAEGNLALHRELKLALPNVALSGEGLNEVTCRYEEFAQRHVWGMDHVENTWNDRAIAMAHPVASAALVPYTTIYGYLGMPNPLGAPDAYDAWLRAYERFGVIPTYAWPTVSQLSPTTHPAIERLLRRVGLFMRHDLTPDFSPTWRPGELFVWRTANGGRVRYVSRQGVALEVQLPGDKSPWTLERRIAGAETVTGPGSIAGWPAYNAAAIVGLHPKRRYDWSPDPRDLSALRLDTVPKGFHLTRAGRHADLFRVGLASHSGAEAYEVRLWEAADTARVGVSIPGGRAVELPGNSLGDDDSGGTFRPDGEGLFIHPPWKGLPRAVNPGAMPGTGSRPIVYGEFRLNLPDLPGLRFEAEAHLRRGALESDGMTFRAAAWAASAPGNPISAEAHADLEHRAGISMDLSALRGRRIVFRLEGDAGPKGDPTYDWGRLERPRLIADPALQPPVEATLRIAGKPPVGRILTATGTAKVTSQPDRGTLVEVELPNVLTVPLSDPQAVQAPLDLTALPLLARSRSEDGLEGPPPQYGPSVGPTTCSGVERKAISLHPPTRGAALLDYHLKLPDTPLALDTAIGIRDGSKSNGVGFRVEVNGKVLFSRDLKPGSGWLPAIVDLTAYAGKEIVLTLVTDALGDFNFDWSVWAEPRLVRSAGSAQRRGASPLALTRLLGGDRLGGDGRAEPLADPFGG